MDDFIQIIVFLFFIFSIFGSLLGKKKPQQKRPQRIPQRRPGERTSSPSPRTQYSTNEVLEELFGVKLPKTGNEYPNMGRDYESMDVESRSPSLESSSLEYSVQGVEQKDIPDIDYDTESSLETSIISTMKISSESYEKKSTRSVGTEIRKKIKSASTFKDAIIISEIINKPKSLRR